MALPTDMLGALARLGATDPDKLAALLAERGIDPLEFIQATQAATGGAGSGSLAGGAGSGSLAGGSQGDVFQIQGNGPPLGVGAPSLGSSLAGGSPNVGGGAGAAGGLGLLTGGIPNLGAGIAQAPMSGPGAIPSPLQPPNPVPIGAKTPVGTAAAQQAAGPSIVDKLTQAVGALQPAAQEELPDPQLLGAPRVQGPQALRPQGLQQLLQLIMSGASGGNVQRQPTLGQLIGGR